jgi:hypothetical protein
MPPFFFPHVFFTTGNFDDLDRMPGARKQTGACGAYTSRAEDVPNCRSCPHLWCAGLGLSALSANSALTLDDDMRKDS